MSESQHLIGSDIDTENESEDEAVDGTTSPTAVTSVDSSNNYSLVNDWRNLTAFWLLGLCNNYAYVVMLSAAHDLLAPASSNSTVPGDNLPAIHERAVDGTGPRDCNPTSTGAVLLADIIPALLVKSASPLLNISTHARVSVAVVFSALSFILAAVSSQRGLIFLGVILASMSSGLGEVTLLAHSAQFATHAVSTWSSGTGFSGVLGSFAYAALTAEGLTPHRTLLLMLVCPVIMAITYICLLRHPSSNSSPPPRLLSQSVAPNSEQHVPLTMRQKLRLLPRMPAYMLPLGSVYFFEYFINQGLLELVWFRRGTRLTHGEQYRWFQVAYQIGVFVSRSSLSVVRVRRIWLLAVLQAMNACIFVAQAWLMFIPQLWCVVVIVLWEGLLGGAAYVNTFATVHDSFVGEEREFFLGTVTLADSLGIALAGAVSLPVHDAFCKLPLPKVR